MNILLVADTFTSNALTESCDRVTHLTPDSFRDEILQSDADFLFVESAWQGRANTWCRKLSPPSLQILECINLCKSLNIPTVFWNKEDPVHFGTFLPLARYFDHVFTTDIDCIPRYKKELGHEHVSLLPFASQPTLHNPFPTIARKRGFCFAGSWYQRYPGRQRDFTNLADTVSSIGPLEIYDRNYYDTKEETKFPSQFNTAIKGFLPFEKIDTAYKGYRFALNINTVTRSQSMFARRIFELMSSNTIVVSNNSNGMHLFFGDLVITSSTPSILREKIIRLWDDETLYRKHRALALRSILREHTYAHRLDYIKSRIQGKRWQPERPEVLILAVADSFEAEKLIVSNILRQEYPCRALLLRQYDHRSPISYTIDQRIIYHTAQDDCINEAKKIISKNTWLAFFVSNDIYGPHYLTDLIQARHYSNANAFGKSACYIASKGKCILKDDGAQYLPTAKLAARSSLIRSEALPEDWLDDCLNDVPNLWLNWPNMLAIDEFQYCRDGSLLPAGTVKSTINDLSYSDIGLSLAEDILPIAERLSAADYRQPVVDSKAIKITADALIDWLTPRLPNSISLNICNSALVVVSRARADELVTLYAAQYFKRSEFNMQRNNQFRLQVEHDLSELKTIIEYYDADNKALGHTANLAGSTYSLIVPEECQFLRFALQLQGPGQARIYSLILGNTFDSPAVSIALCARSSNLPERRNRHYFQRAGASPLSLSNGAQAAFSAGQYSLAIELYEQAIANQPELAQFYAFHQNLTRQRMRQTAMSTTTFNKTQAQRHLTPAAKTPHFATLTDINHKISLATRALSNLDSLATPTVSILITSHNSRENIEESVTSALRQNWPSLEVIVVDSASTDATWAILQRLQKSVANLHCRRINTDLGINFAKNYAIQIAKGEYIFFQNGDDLSHPDRIRLSMSKLLQPDVVAVRGAYSRVMFPSCQVISLNGSVSRLGLQAIGLKRRVFDEIGFFNCTCEADDEFLLRLETWATQIGAKFPELDLPLYFQSVQEHPHNNCDLLSNSFFDNEGAKRNSTAKEEYIATSARLHGQLGAGRFRQFFRFPVIRDLIPVSPEMSKLANPIQPVIVSLCSIPERADLLRQVLASLAPQVDALHVYLDRYESIPDFVLNCHSQVTVYLSKDHPGLRDNGKFLAFAALSEDCYYFTADDDIIYPPDYVASMVRRIEDYGRQAVIGVHGVLLPEQAEGYFSSYRKVHMFKKELERDALVNNLGTGTVAFHSGLLRGLDLTHFGTPGMADLHLSVFCKQRNIPMVALARPEDWLQELPSPNTSLYTEFHQADDQQSALIRAHKPWGYTAISQAVAGATMRASNPQVGERLQRLIPVLHACLK
ncbi:glycosyltransferase [Pseudomonas fulva]|nr:glycosyltransferase [Pseudomonas fulva]MBF8780857.1 glycosyltransferase [Pseudomonas fulva]